MPDPDLQKFIERCAYLEGFLEGVKHQAEATGAAPDVPKGIMEEAQGAHSAVLYKLLRRNGVDECRT